LREQVVRVSKVKKVTSKPTNLDVSVILNFAPGLTKEEFNTHKFTFTYKKDYINTFCFKLGDIELRKFYFERYHHISHGIWNYFESQFAKKPATNTKIKSIDEQLLSPEGLLPEEIQKLVRERENEIYINEGLENEIN
jgi:hypothetical protein